jgi:hypothetical protein
MKMEIFQICIKVVDVKTVNPTEGPRSHLIGRMKKRNFRSKCYTFHIDATMFFHPQKGRML